MSAEKLKALVEKGNLINLNIISDSLANLLNEIGAMLIDQQNQIISLRDEIRQKTPQQDFDILKDQCKSDRETMKQISSNLDNKISQTNVELKMANDEMKNFVENSMANSIVAANNQITQKVDMFSNEQNVLQENVAKLEEKINEILNNYNGGGEHNNNNLKRSREHFNDEDGKENEFQKKRSREHFNDEDDKENEIRTRNVGNKMNIEENENELKQRIIKLEEIVFRKNADFHHSSDHFKHSDSNNDNANNQNTRSENLNIEGNNDNNNTENNTTSEANDTSNVKNDAENHNDVNENNTENNPNSKIDDNEPDSSNVKNDAENNEDGNKNSHNIEDGINFNNEGSNIDNNSNLTNNNTQNDLIQRIIKLEQIVLKNGTGLNDDSDYDDFNRDEADDIQSSKTQFRERSMKSDNISSQDTSNIGEGEINENDESNKDNSEKENNLTNENANNLTNEKDNSPVKTVAGSQSSSQNHSRMSSRSSIRAAVRAVPQEPEIVQPDVNKQFVIEINEQIKVEFNQQLNDLKEQIAELSKKQEELQRLEEEMKKEQEQKEESQSEYEEENVDYVEQLRNEITQIEQMLEEQNRNLISRIERKSEISLVERMFEKLRVLIANAKDEVEAMKARLELFIDKDQMIEYVNSVIKNLLDDHSSVTNRHYKCLACGRPKVIPTPVDNTGASPISSSRDSHNTSELPSLKFTIPRI